MCGRKYEVRAIRAMLFTPPDHCAKVKRRLMPMLVFADGNEVEITGVLMTRS
jgi:hypothetical protein